MNQPGDCPFVPVSWGELIDKITILQIKHERIADPRARANVDRELAMLRRIAVGAIGRRPMSTLIGQLRGVNEALWEIEDSIREREEGGDFGRDFVQLARSVYRKNDQRAAIKREINERLGSALIEEKSYAGCHSCPPGRRACSV